MERFLFWFSIFVAIHLIAVSIVIVISFIHIYYQYKLACLYYDIDCKYKAHSIGWEDYLAVKRLREKYTADSSKENYLELKQKMTEVLNRSSNNPLV